MAKKTSVKNYTVSSRGLWLQKDDISTVLNCKISLHIAGNKKPDGYIGWGDKRSGKIARSMAFMSRVPFIQMEDGFLRSWSAGQKELSASYVVDHSGMYYNSKNPSDLETMLLKDDFSDLIDRSKSAIQEIVSNRLSKYNDSPIRALRDIGINKKYIVLIEQVTGDQSISGSGATNKSFEDMLLQAKEEYPDHQIVIKAHPAAKGAGLLMNAALKHKIDTVNLVNKVNLWNVLEDSDHVYTVSSQAGFEALMANKKVTCFGIPFYSNYGVTTDVLDCKRRNNMRTVPEIFAASYINYTKYLSLHDRSLTSLENIIDELSAITKSRRKHEKRFVTVGLSKNKQKNLSPFLRNIGGKPIHMPSLISAQKVFEDNNNIQLAVWGYNNSHENLKLVQHENLIPITRLEDGFIRSVGLGAALNAPSSIVVDTSGHLHFDCSGESDIEKLMMTLKVNELQKERANDLKKTIINHRLSKYMLNKKTVILPAVDKLKILIPGQVETDASLKYGSPEIKTNTDLINKVREIFPDAFIAFKEHPDVSNGLRSGKADTKNADMVVNDHDIIDLIDWCDRVETLTSLTGFEALIRGKSVGTHGYPFYAGYGLTDDRISIEYQRKRKQIKDINEMIYIALIEYPLYIHPLSKLPCTPEMLIKYMSTYKESLYEIIKKNFMMTISRMRYYVLKN